jgi:hypothetical protein
MFTYSEEKVPGYKESDRAKLLPSTIDSLILAIIFLNVLDLVCGIRVSKADTRGKPAPTIVASCLVIIETSDGRTRLKYLEMKKERGSFFVAVSETSLMETGKVLDARSFWRAISELSASIIPEVVFPLMSRALYSYTGILTTQKRIKFQHLLFKMHDDNISFFNAFQVNIITF